MELAFIVYLIGILPNINVFFVTIAICLAVFSFFYSIMGLTSNESCKYDSYETIKEKMTNRSSIKKNAIKAVIVASFLGFTANLIPSEKTMYTMVGAYAVQKVAENPDVQRLQGKVLKVIEVKLDEYVKESESVVQSKK